MRTTKKRATALKLVDTNEAPTEPEQQPEPDMLTIVLNLVFTVDGAPVVSNPARFQIPKPGPEVDTATLQVALDGRVLLKLLEPALGPSQASAAPKLWTPSAPQGMPSRRLKD